jgi:hypothetical protein
MSEYEKMDWKAYDEGFKRCKEVDNDVSQANNPYEKDTESWGSWNRGWNEYGMGAIGLDKD